MTGLPPVGKPSTPADGGWQAGDRLLPDGRPAEIRATVGDGDLSLNIPAPAPRKEKHMPAADWQMLIDQAPLFEMLMDEDFPQNDHVTAATGGREIWFEHHRGNGFVRVVIRPGDAYSAEVFALDTHGAGLWHARLSSTPVPVLRALLAAAVKDLR